MIPSTFIDLASIDVAHNMYKCPFPSLPIILRRSILLVFFVLDDLFAPTTKDIDVSPHPPDKHPRRTYYRDGKKRPSSGNFVRVSLSALSFHINPVSPTITMPKTAVFAFQFAGREYQPPAGDQTCLGYLGDMLGAI